MLTLCLSTILLAAPIPKESKEGTIAVLLQGKETQVVLLSPRGEEYNRVTFKDYLGHPYCMALAPSGNRIVFLCSEHGKVRNIGREDYQLANGYVLNLEQGEKPKLLFDDKINPRWVIGQDSETAFGSEDDQEDMAKNPGNIHRFKSWKLNLKTGVSEPLPISADYVIVDTSHDNKTFLTKGYGNAKMSSAIVKTSDWKPTRISDQFDHAYSMSANSEIVIREEYDWPATPGTENRVVVTNRSKNQHTLLPAPTDPKNKGRLRYKCSPDGKQIAYLDVIMEKNEPDSQRRYEICVCDLDGSNPMIIFESKTTDNFIIHDFDWR